METLIKQYEESLNRVLYRRRQLRYALKSNPEMMNMSRMKIERRIDLLSIEIYDLRVTIGELKKHV